MAQLASAPQNLDQKRADASQRRVYLRPVARLPAALAHGGAKVLRIAGRADLAFAAAELIERDAGGTRRTLLAAEQVMSGGLVPPDLLDRVCRPRPTIAGVSLERTRVMGVVNVTPDSFSDGGRYLDAEAAVRHGVRLAAEGADILDIGGESTRPGSEAVDVQAELARVLPVIERLRGQTRIPISIDTRSAQVMRRAAAMGAGLINDVSALRHDPDSLGAAAELGLPVILMHAQGDPKTMQDQPTYDDVVLDVYDALAQRLDATVAAGIPRERLVVDPGIGFGKTLAHNLALLGGLSVFHGLGAAVMLGASRKSFIGNLTGAATADRLPGSLAAALAGVAQGVQVLRVHDVAETRQALAVWESGEYA